MLKLGICLAKRHINYAIGIALRTVIKINSSIKTGKVEGVEIGSSMIHDP